MEGWLRSYFMVRNYDPFHFRPERIPFDRRRYAFHSSACRMGADRVGPRAVVVSARNHTAAARNFILGHGGMAHGLECERGCNERSNPTASRSADQGAAGIFRAW